jgi:hypothetical protein
MVLLTIDSSLVMFREGEPPFCLSEGLVLAYFSLSSGELKWYIMILILQRRVTGHIPIGYTDRIWSCWWVIKVWWWLDEENLIFADQKYPFWPFWAFSHEKWNETYWNHFHNREWPVISQQLPLVGYELGDDWFKFGAVWMRRTSFLLIKNTHFGLF